ncbi:MAG: hypothetical protein ACFE9I_01560 [Candidatus Hermodarchaeota archaeon]
MDIISEPKTPPKEIVAIVLSIIGPIICLIGGILIIYTGVEKIPLNIASGFAALGEIALGVFTIILALVALKYHLGGMLISFFIGLFAIMINFLGPPYYLSFPGPLLTLIGSVFGLIGVFLTSPAQLKKFGICIIIILIIYFLYWFFGFIMSSLILRVSPP